MWICSERGVGLRGHHPAPCLLALVTSVGPFRPIRAPVADRQDVRPRSVDPCRDVALAYAQAGVLVGAWEAPELEVVSW